jgi:hypothetical protein
MKHTFITHGKREEIIATVQNHPELGFIKIAEILNLSASTVMSVAKRAGITRRRGKASPAYQRGVTNGNS